MKNIKDYNLDELKQELINMGEKPFRAEQIFKWIYQENVSSFDKSSNENIIKFRDYLNDHGIVATIRRELGSDIDAACGQLRRKNINS